MSMCRICMVHRKHWMPWTLCTRMWTDKYQLSKKVVLEGFSRGGLFALNWPHGIPSELPVSTMTRRFAISRVGQAVAAKARVRPLIGTA